MMHVCSMALATRVATPCLRPPLLQLLLAGACATRHLDNTIIRNKIHSSQHAELASVKAAVAAELLDTAVELDLP